VKGAPLTVAEARAILRADEALDLTFEARVAADTLFSNEMAEAWMALVASAKDRIAAWEGTAWEGTKRKETLPTAPDQYPSGNAPDFQTLFLEAETEARDLRVGIETIISVFGTNSAEWAQQFRGLLDRVPVSRRLT
jgi:hypothetical protein